MWQGLRTICSFGNKSSAEVRADLLLAEELNAFHGRFECNSGATLQISASGSSRQSSVDHVIGVSEDEVRRELKRVNVRKAAGPDAINGRVFLGPALIGSLACLLPSLMSPLQPLWFPPPLFKQVIISVPKNNKASCLNDYRLVALTSIVMKVYEILVKNYIRSSIPDSWTLFSLPITPKGLLKMPSLISSTLPSHTLTATMGTM